MGILAQGNPRSPVTMKWRISSNEKHLSILGNWIHHRKIFTNLSKATSSSWYIYILSYTYTPHTQGGEGALPPSLEATSLLCRFLSDAVAQPSQWLICPPLDICISYIISIGWKKIQGFWCLLFSLFLRIMLDLLLVLVLQFQLGFGFGGLYSVWVQASCRNFCLVLARYIRLYWWEMIFVHVVGTHLQRVTNFFF